MSQFQAKGDSQVSDSQFALKGSSPSSLPAQGLVGLVQSPLRHLQKRGGKKYICPRGNKGLHDLEKQTFLQFKGSKAAAGNLLFGLKILLYTYI